MPRKTKWLAEIIDAIQRLPEPFTYVEVLNELPREVRYDLTDWKLANILASWCRRGRLSARARGRRGAPTQYRRTAGFTDCTKRNRRRGYRGPRVLPPVERRYRAFLKGEDYV